MSRSADSPAIGIDLGTTYSVVAALDERGQPRTLLNAEGQPLTPSVALFDGETVIVGKEAQKALATDADLVAVEPKREMGERVYHRALADQQWPPEVIQAFILRKLALDAERHVGPVQRAVITVPAYFDEARRKATQDAGYMAGLEVLDILNEPTAAAIAFGHAQGLVGAAPSGSRKVLVYDLGGGTFDVSVMDLMPGQFTALATDGDVRLGGRDWDQRLIDFAAQHFVQQFDLDPREDENAAARLARECEDVKRTLSTRSKATLAFDWRSHALRMELTRDEWELMTKDLVDRTRFTVRQTLRAGGLQWSDIERVLLVGGATRLPMVRDMLRALSGKAPDDSVAADEAVAHGAALHAGALLDLVNGRQPQFQVKNVSSHSLGVVATDPSTGRARNAVIIPRNTPLPVAARRIFHTQRDDQQSILLQILEGEGATPDACIALARCVVRDLPRSLPARSPVDVRFQYQADGRLQVWVLSHPEKPPFEVELDRPNSLNRAELFKWRQIVSDRLARS